MVWSNNVTVFGIGTNGGERSFVDDSFDLHDCCAENVDVEGLATEDHFEMFLEDADDAFPASSIVTSVRRNKFPLQSSFPQLGLHLTIEMLHLPFQDLVCGCHICPTIRSESTGAWTPGVEADDGVDKRGGVQFVHDFTMY